MRMWMVNPRLMCDKHLLGEHVELHMLVGTLQRKRSVTGFAANNLIELTSLQGRHNALALEMLRRGMNHKSALPEVDINYLPDKVLYALVDVEKSTKDLTSRCEECAKRHANVQKLW